MSKTPVVKIPKQEGKKHANLLFIIPVALVVLVVVIAAVLLVPSMHGEQSSAQKLMQKYYENLYAADLTKLPECMPEELRDTFEQVSTMGGVSSSVYLTYRQQMEEEVGENIQVEVKITSNENGGSTKLKSTQEDFPKASTVNLIDFDVTLTGDKGSTTMEGTTYITKIGSQWYLTTYNLLLNKKA